MDAVKFGLFVARARKDKNMTQAELAAKIKVTDKAVSRWERGLGFPDINTIEPLSEALGVSVLELMKSEKIETKDIQCEDATIVLKDTINEANCQRILKRKQYKIITIGVVSLFLTISVLLLFALNRSRYVTLIQCEDLAERESVESVLASEGIVYKVLLDELTVTVLDEDCSRARLILGANNIPANDNFIEIKLKEDITSYFDKIKNADINFYTFSNGEKRVSILLELQSNLSVEEIEYLVATVSEVTGIRDVDNIVIVDTDGNCLN